MLTLPLSFNPQLSIKTPIRSVTVIVRSMENHESVVEMGGSNGTSRWNPTKEQISMLENLYKKGIKTPTAEEIQQITASLRVYGHIEGKNVFYWFQNHKARQRQKQKQETIAYFNRYLHTPPHPFFSPPSVSPNGLCAPYCIAEAESEIGFYPQQAKVLVPVGFRRSPAEKVGMSSMICNGPLVCEGMQKRISDCNLSYSNQETLDLFPLHPTGILEAKTTGQVSSTSTHTPSASPDINQHDASPPDQPFFDFFTTSGQGS